MINLALSLLLTAFLFLVVELVLTELARHYTAWRFPAPVRYALGVGAVMLLSLPLVILNGWQQAWGVIVAHFVAGGSVVALWWQFSNRQPVEHWPGMGPNQLTLDAISLIENMMAYRVQLEQAQAEAEQNTKMIKLCQVMLRHLKADDGAVDLSDAGMRILAEEMDNA